tara:strand:+ start:1313 stop:4153 length:2841 start_codon:yes stop_codon:yes gene_type:complete
MAGETAKEKKDRQEALALTLRQVEATEAVAEAQQKHNKLLEEEGARRKQMNESDVRYNRTYSNTLIDQVKHLNLQGNEKAKITSLSKKLVSLAEKVYTFDVKGLGTTSKASKIQNDILKTQQSIKILALQKNDYTTSDAKLQKEVNDNINKQIGATAIVLAQLEKQRDVAKEIEDNKIAGSFNFVAKTLEKIPLLRNLAPAFKEGADAAREMGTEITLFREGMLDATDYSEETMAKFGKNAKVQMSHTQEVADHAQALFENEKKRQGAKGFKAKKVDKTKLKGLKSDASEAGKKVGTKSTLFGEQAKKGLAEGSAKLVGVNKQMATMKAGWRKMGPVIAKLAAAFLFDSLMKADKMLNEVRNNLGVSYGTAYKLNIQFNEMANSSDNLRVNLKSIREASAALNDSYGTALMFNEQTLVTSAEIVQSKLLDGQATANLSMQSRINGKTMKASLKDQEDAVHSVNKENKTRISLRGVMKASAKVQGQISAQMGGDAGRISKAVTQAKALGMELNQVAAAGKQMLDFESSIENELTAELMLGKSLNLEKARLAALTGDYETLTQEINKNVGDFGDFTQMNVLQQDALAASLGMTSDQLSDQLMKKANLEELAEEALANNDKQLYQDLVALDNQEKFKLAVQGVKDAFVGVMAVISPVANVIGLMIDGMRALAPLILIAAGAMAIYKAQAIGAAIVKGWESAFSTVGKTPYVGIFLAMAAGLAIAGAISNSMKKAGDVMSPADGKTQISTKEGGLFELSKNDDVAAGPGILDKLKNAGKSLFSSGGGINIEPLVNSLKNLSTMLSGKFDVLIATGNATNSLITSLNSLSINSKSKNNEIQTPLLPKLGDESRLFGIFSGLSNSIDNGGINDMEGVQKQEETISNSTGRGEITSISLLEKKLDEMIKVLQQRQNIKLDVNNTMKHDSWSDNNVSNLGGKETQQTINESTFS